MNAHELKLIYKLVLGTSICIYCGLKQHLCYCLHTFYQAAAFTYLNSNLNALNLFIYTINYNSVNF